MNGPDRFQKRALHTWYAMNDTPSIAVDIKWIAAAMGLSGAAGEFLDAVKKMALKPGYKVSRNRLIEELGDVFFYICVLSYMLGISIDELSLKNREKLAKEKHGWIERRAK